MTTHVARAIAMLVCLVTVPAAAVAQDASPAPRTLGGYARTIGRDLKSMIDKDNATVMSSATALALVAWPFDETLTNSASCSTFLKTSFDGWARIAGQEWLMAAGALGTYAIGRTLDHPQLQAVGGDLIEAEIVAGITTHVLKYTTQRMRPDGEEFSFPSGHAAGTFAAATVLQRHFGLKAALPAYTVATLISTARLQANSHYPTDIIMGAAFGIFAGRSATMELASHRIRMAPVISPGGVAIMASID